MNEIIANEKDMIDEIFGNYFKYQNPSSLAKNLIRATKAKKENLVINLNDGLINIRNVIIKKIQKMKIQTIQSKFSSLICSKNVKKLKD